MNQTLNSCEIWRDHVYYWAQILLLNAHLSVFGVLQGSNAEKNGKSRKKSVNRRAIRVKSCRNLFLVITEYQQILWCHTCINRQISSCKSLCRLAVFFPTRKLMKNSWPVQPSQNLGHRFYTRLVSKLNQVCEGPRNLCLFGRAGFLLPCILAFFLLLLLGSILNNRLRLLKLSAESLLCWDNHTNLLRQLSCKWNPWKHWGSRLKKIEKGDA